MTETEAKWAERVRGWRESGQTAADFARGREYEASTLRYWSSMLKRKLKARATIPARVSVRMVRVRRAAPTADNKPIVLEVGSVRVEVRSGFDRTLLRAVVEAIGTP